MTPELALAPLPGGQKAEWEEHLARTPAALCIIYSRTLYTAGRGLTDLTTEPRYLTQALGGATEHRRQAGQGPSPASGTYHLGAPGHLTLGLFPPL